MPTLEWVAVFQDEKGQLHTFRQPSPDPVKGFADVQKLEKKGQLISFFLDLPGKKQAVGINLKQGFFIFSGYFNHNPAPEIQKLNPTYRLINFRRSYRDKGTGGYDSGIQISHYILGWQTTINEENIQRLMFIDSNTLEIQFKEKR